MRPAELFGVVIRTIALVFFIYSFFDLAQVVLKALDISTGSSRAIEVDLVSCGVWFLVGFILWWKADFMVRLAYGR